MNKDVKNGVTSVTPLNEISIPPPVLLEEILKTYGEDGILAMQRIRSEIEMKKRRKIIDDHPYKPTYNEKSGRWYTRFNQGDKLVQRSRKTLKELEDCIVDYYANNKTLEEPPSNKYTFTKAHDRWMATQKDYGKDNNSIRHYETDWNRFFDGTEFSKKELTEITPRDIEVFMIGTIKKLNLKRRAADSLYTYINGVFYNAVMDRKLELDKNPCNLVDKKRFVKFINTEEKTAEERTLSPDELAKLIKKVDEDICRRPTYIYPYGVQLSILTGMRVGEIAGLRWKHVTDNYIKVCESEKYDVVEKRYYQSGTKTGKIRYVPITDRILEFLDKMRERQEKYGITEDFILSFADGKLRCKNLTAYMNHKCEQLKFDSHKSIHAIRRTFNSYLRYNGASAIEAGDLIGNTPRVNDVHYTYDIQDTETKRKYMESAEARMVQTQ